MQTLNLILIDDECEKFDTKLKHWFNKYASEEGKDIQFEITSASNPESGMALLKSSNGPDLIILDLYLRPSSDCFDSYQIVRYAKEHIPNSPILVLSATKQIRDIQEVSNNNDCNVDGFLSKDDTLNKGKETGVLNPDFKLIYDNIFLLLLKYGRIHVHHGILITHGTDTMSWAFAILRYGLYNVKTNIILTGSQLPLEGTFSPSDAIGNMLTSVKLLNMLEPPNIVQVFNDGVHIFNKNLNKVKKWAFDAFIGQTFGIIETEEFKIFEEGINKVTIENRIEKLHFIKTGGTIDSKSGETGLSATADYTTQFLISLKYKYFDDFLYNEINPKDSSLFTTYDWSLMLIKIGETQLAIPDLRFDWKILSTIFTPFMEQNFYENLLDLVVKDYSGVIILGYGAGNVNIFNSRKVEETRISKKNYEKYFGKDATAKQTQFSAIPFFEKIEAFNKTHSDDYKFVVMSSQVPFDCYDNEYQSGTIPLYYGALPSGDLSYPEAQTKLAYILGHKDMIIEKAKAANITFEQVVKSAFLSGVKFIRERNKKAFLRISEIECGCRIAPHSKNLFVKLSFEVALEQVIQQLQ